ncbi:MAG TPA: hypothetical protein VMH33_11540 [Solirubrobacterales bacterium]|nr:hypothetical protein [Solirubrobacterales bacterium]
MSPDRAKTNDVPKGSYAAGERAKMPAGAEPPYAVFINGVEQKPGVDYEIEGREIHFTRAIIKEEIGISRWLAMYLGIFGTYRKDEKVDLQFHREGKVELVPDLPVVPYGDEDGG